MIFDTFRWQISKPLQWAIQARVSAKVRARRATFTLGALGNAAAVEAPPGLTTSFGALREIPRKLLTGFNIVDVISSEVREREATAADYRQRSQEQMAHDLIAEATIIRECLSLVPGTALTGAEVHTHD